MGNDLIKRIARAICTASDGSNPDDLSPESIPNWKYHTAEASAAIGALRPGDRIGDCVLAPEEASFAMLLAARDVYEDGKPTAPGLTYRAMIEAVKDPPMTTADDWSALSARCAEATGADKHINADLYEACGYRLKPEYRLAQSPEFTDSLDAIVSLIEKTLPGCEWGVANRTYDIGPHAWIGEGDVTAFVGATPVLALCASFCAAMAARAEITEREGK